MSAMTAELLALYDTDKPAFVLAVADLMEADWINRIGHGEDVRERTFHLAVVRRWRGVVKRHTERECANVRCDVKRSCTGCDPDNVYFCNERPWPCPDLAETADEARAYLGAS